MNFRLFIFIWSPSALFDMKYLPVAGGKRQAPPQFPVRGVR
jgi:hypothetical protein